MLRVGLLPPPPHCAVLELGAGKGYLALMLSDCFGLPAEETRAEQHKDGMKGGVAAALGDRGEVPRGDRGEHQEAREAGSGDLVRAARGELKSSQCHQPSPILGGPLGPVVLLDCRGFKNKVRGMSCGQVRRE